MRLLTLVPDAYGGRGGIAKFNRDLLGALSAYSRVNEVVAVPRVIVDDIGSIPACLAYAAEAARGTPSYLEAFARHGLLSGRYDGIVCGHLNLLPLAAMAAMRSRAPLIQIVHGIEAWRPPSGVLRSFLLDLFGRRVDAVVSVSALTLKRLGDWMPLEGVRSFVVPNCIDVSAFGPGPKCADLLARYGLSNRTVLLTLARLSATERYKGVDEVMESLPALSAEIPNISYLICGDGDDRARLEHKARELGVADRVVFAGYVPEHEKADHYRLADAFVMPGSGEGFGIVYLEALACGIPVMASLADASREAVLDGRLGVVVDPADPDHVRRGILQTLRLPRVVPAGLSHFSYECFRERWHGVLDDASVQPAASHVDAPETLIQAPTR